MSLKANSHEERGRQSLIELAKVIVAEKREEMNFNDLFTAVAELKGLTNEEKQAKIGQFYTELNMDGNFTTNGANVWGLKGWYQTERIGRSMDDKKSGNTPKRSKAQEETDFELEAYEAAQEEVNQVNERDDEEEIRKELEG